MLPNAVAVTFQAPRVSTNDHNFTEASGMPRSVVQWWRLRGAWWMLQTLERGCNHQHRAVVRVRADLRITMPPASSSLSALFADLTKAAAASERVVIMASDYAFAAERSTMERIATFYDRIEAGDWFADPLRCHPIDYQALIESDWEARGPCLLKYGWINYPRTVFDALKVKSCKAIGAQLSLLRDALLVSRRDGSLAGGHANGSRHAGSLCGSCFPGNLKLMNGFESERSFLMYLLVNGIRMRRWPTHTKLGNLNDGCCCAGAGASEVPRLSHGGRMTD